MNTDGWWWLVKHISTVLLVAFALVGGVVEMAYSHIRILTGSESGSVQLLGDLLMFASFSTVIGMTVLVVQRQRRPFLLTVLGAILAIALPVGPVFAMIGLPELILRERGRRMTVGIIATFVAIVVSTFTDVLTTATDASMLGAMGLGQLDATAGEIVPVIAVLVIIILLSIGVPVGVGMLLRYRGRELQARRRGDELGGELARSQERELIAHEIHDVLGHRLSQISLQAGALEAKATGHPEFREAAEQLRTAAARSMDDLRSLLRVIQGEAQQVSLTQLSDIIREQVVDDRPLSQTVYLQDAESASAELSRGVVRIVQEVITNAQKHAPGLPMRISVVGGPATGITISAANHLADGPPTGTGTGRGMSGMEERVRVLGGQFQAGTVGKEFRVDVNLPWSADR